MICKWCAWCADTNRVGKIHTEGNGHFLKACKGGTHCDCQHREPGTAFDPIYKRNEWLVKRINEGLPIV